MEARELHDNLTDLLQLYASKLDQRQVTFVREDLEVGEWENAASNLAASLAKTDVAVSHADKAQLTRMLGELDSPLEFVEQLRVEAEPQ